MKPNEYREFCKKAFLKRKRFCALGPPGVGKTMAKIDACNEIGYDYIGLCAPLEDPSTIRGYPSRGADGRATHCLFDGIARAFDATGPTVLDFDDLGMSSESTMRSIVRLFQFGEIDNRRLPDDVVLSASTNDVGHGAGVYGMIEPLKSRFHTIIPVETSLDDVVQYGLSRNWPYDLIAYLRNTPDALHDWKPEKSMKVGGACPRSWGYVAELINDGFDDPEVISGAVGPGRGAQYLSFRQLIGELPDVAQCLLDPDSAPVPSNPSAQWLVSMAIASKLEAGNFAQGLKYLLRLPPMFRAFSVRDAFLAESMKRKDQKLPKDYRPLASSRDFAAWSASEDGKAIMSAAGAK